MNWGLPTTDTYCLTVREGTGLRSRCQQGRASSEGSREGSSLPLPNFWKSLAVVAFLGLWLQPSSLCLHLYMTVFSVCLCVSSPLLIKTPGMLDSEPTLVHYDLILTTYDYPNSKRGHIQRYEELRLQHSFFGGGGLRGTIQS